MKKAEQNTKIKYYGYARTSKDSSDIQTQVDEIKRYCSEKKIELTKMIEDEDMSGMKTTRNERGLETLIDDANREDEIIVFDITRVGRKMLDVFIMIEKANKLGVIVVGIKNNVRFDGSLNSNMMLSCFGMGAQIEVHMIKERTKAKLNKLRNEIKEGKNVVKKNENYKMIGICGQVRTIEDEDGKKTQVLRKGTKYKSNIDKYKETIIQKLKDKVKMKDIAKELDIKYNTLAVYITRNKLRE